MKENKILVPKEILNFLTGIYYEKNKEDIASRKEKIFNRAFEMAYKDMSTHTVAYKKDTEVYSQFIDGQTIRVESNKKKIRETIKRYIKGWFINNGTGSYDLTELQKINSPGAFNKWHEKLCDKIVTINCEVEQLQAKDETVRRINISDILCHTDKNIQSGVFTYGQAQKLVNMMLKYLYIYYKCEGWNDLDDLVTYFHVPIDSYVLKEALQDEKYNDIPWSKINCYEEYICCQEEIQTFVQKRNYPNAFMWELTEWPFNS